MTYPKISIIILNWNKKDLLAKCLETLKDNTDYDNYRVVAVDNGSEDGSSEMVEQSFKWAELVENKENLGFSKGNNVGIKYALKNHDPDFVLLLNNDTEIIQKDWLKELVKAGSVEGIGITTGVELHPHQIATFYGGNENTKFAISDSKGETGSCLLIKRGVIEKIGLLDEIFSPYSSEDVDYFARVRKAGYKTAYTRKAPIFHHVSASRSFKTPYSLYIAQRNAMRRELLNSPFHKLAIELLSDFVVGFLKVFMVRKDKFQPISLSNLEIAENILTRLRYFFEAYLDNIKIIRELIYKRRHRLEKIWY